MTLDRAGRRGRRTPGNSLPAGRRFALPAEAQRVVSSLRLTPRYTL